MPLSANSLYMKARATGKRLPVADEEVIATKADNSYSYARDVVKGRFALGEPAIAMAQQNISDQPSWYLREIICVYCPEQYETVFRNFVKVNPDVVIGYHYQQDLQWLDFNLVFAVGAGILIRSWNKKEYAMHSIAGKDVLGSLQQLEKLAETDGVIAQKLATYQQQVRDRATRDVVPAIDALVFP